MAIRHMRTTLIIPDPLTFRLQNHLTATGLSMSEVIRCALDLYLRSTDQQPIKAFAVPSPIVPIVKIDSESPNLLSEADLDLLRSRDEAIQSTPRTIIAVRPVDAPAPIRRLVQVPHERMSAEQKAALAERIAAGGADAESQKCKPAK